jgi:hypothetical protein
MAYNNLTGTVLQPGNLVPRIDAAGNVVVPIVSGNLSTSDGAAVINVPRVSNATNNAILTNINGDANTLTCESNLTFDGTTLNISGDLSASIAISASYFEGDGSRLTGINAGGGSSAGIFNEINGSQANTTSSILVGTEATPQTTFQVVGSSFMSGAVTHKRKFVNSNYTVSTTDYYVGVDSNNNVVKITLPQASAMLDGQTMIVKDEAGTSNVNHITISGSSNDTIDGQNQVILESPFASIQLYCNGADKFFIF